jgi:hypothetical protein
LELAGEYDCFQENFPVSMTGGAMIAAEIFSISLDLIERVEGKKKTYVGKKRF